MSDHRSEERSERWRWLWTSRAPRVKGLALVTGAVALGLGMWTAERASAPEEPASIVDTEPSEASPAVETSRLSAVRVRPESDEQRRELLALAVDLWSEHPGAPTLDLVVDEAGRRWLTERSIEAEELVPDIVALAEAERERLSSPEAARPIPPEHWFSEYRDLDTIHTYVEQLAQLRPDLVQHEIIGHSLEGRALPALRIHGAGTATTTMLVNGGLHAREWIAVMSTTCVADRLIRGYDRDARLRRFVDDVELLVVPVSNPDGYLHSWRHDRYWRKNRRDDHGVDLNRNFSVAWGGSGSSDNTSSQVYRGTAPFSEPESAALRMLVESERFDAHIDFHSYGQLLLHPWSYTRKKSSEHRVFRDLAQRMAGAIKAEHGERYRPIAGASLYPAAGTMMDWTYGTYGTKSFVIELRPRGGSGFVLPPDQIMPTCDEALAAVLTLGEGLRRKTETTADEHPEIP